MSYTPPFTGSFTITSYFGVVRKNLGQSKPHTGIDIVGKSSKEIKAITSGTVATVSYDPKGYGNYVIINHSTDGGCSLYAHMSRTNVKVGDAVTPNTTLGIMGSTGNSTGPHLHLEIETSQPWKSRTNLIDPAAALGLSTNKTIYNSGGSINTSSQSDSPLVGGTNRTLATLLDGYETLPILDSQPYYAFVDLIFGGHQLPSVPSNYLQNLTVQDIGSGDGATISMVLLDKYGDEIEELLYKSSSEDNYVRFGHVTGRQSKLLKFKLLTYAINFEPQGTILTISGISNGAYQNLSTDNIFSAGSSPSEAVKSICDKLGYQYDDTTIQPSNQIKLSDGTVREFNLIRDNLIDYIHKEIAPYAVRSSDGVGGYQFYIDQETDPPTAYFHPVEISDNVIRTYVYQKGLNTNVISFEVSADFVISGEGATGITSVLEANVLDPLTKEESIATSDINDVKINVNGEYSHIESNQSTELFNSIGKSYGEAVSNINYRMVLSQKTFDADLTIVGDPTIKINNEIRIIILTKKNTLHHCSGLYLVKGVSHSISSGIMITTLNVTKLKDADGVELKSYKSLYK